MKLFRQLTLTIMIFLGAGCAKKEPASTVAEKPKVVKQTRVSRSFSDIKFEGDIDVTIEPARRGSKLVLVGDSRDLEKVVSQQNGNKVFVSTIFSAPRHGPIKAIMSSAKLRKLSYEGTGNISGKGLRTSRMDLQLYINGKVDLAGRLDIKRLAVTGKNKVKLSKVTSRDMSIKMNGDADVKIDGMVNLRKMRYQGSGKLAMYWVNTPDLVVEGQGSAKVYLAGVAHYLHATIGGSSELDARYLRVSKSYVKAKDHATVRLVPIKELNAFASDHGHIYYYKSPRFKAEYMAQNGSILNFVRYK